MNPVPGMGGHHGPYVPGDVYNAARRGDVAAVRQWLENGGDPNLGLDPHTTGMDFSLRILLRATEYGRCDVIRALVAHGADVNHVVPVQFGYFKKGLSATTLAIRRGYRDVTRLLLASGADVNQPMATGLVRPWALRMLLIAGADLSARSCFDETPEDFARRRHAHYVELSTRVGGIEREEHYVLRSYAESISILEGTRLAGSYKNFVLREFKQLLRLRSLLSRRRARIGPGTPEIVARLFGGSTARTRPPTRRHRLLERAAGVPDPAFWLVMEYWRLGNWRRPA